MGIGEKQIREERKWLEDVISEIQKQLEKYEEFLSSFKKELIRTQQDMRDEISLVATDLNDLADIWQYQMDIARYGARYKHSSKQVGRLLRMLGNPYFARLDFAEEGYEKTETMYIGISNLSVEETGEYLVYDWRAPVSGMFYDYETGPARYKCPAGIINGELLIKRQYKISKGQLIYAFDSSIKIDDEILQGILARSSSSKMKTIVTTIQKEQNRIIRDEDNKVLIVDGPAGSGKTSVALHRAAFLLYRYKDDIKPEDVVIFSPNSIFSDYISNVLPQLGEENIQRLTFIELAAKILGKAYKMEGSNELIEYLLDDRGKNSKERNEGIRYKSSWNFIERIKEYVNYLGNEGFSFEDVFFNDVLIESKEELEKYFYKELKFLPVIKRLEKIKGRLIKLLKEPEKQRSKEIRLRIEQSGEFMLKEELRYKCMKIVNGELKPVYGQIDKMTVFDCFKAYENFLSENYLDKGERLYYEDIAPLVLLKVLLEGIHFSSKHIIIDEMQDYSPAQMECFRLLYPYVRFTFVGDLNQWINPAYGIYELDFVEKVFSEKKPTIIKLNKTYRSTLEITAFCNEIKKSRVKSVERKGTKPKIFLNLHGELLIERLQPDIKGVIRGGCSSIAVICKTAIDAENLYNLMKEHMDVKLIKSSDDEFKTGLVVLPSYLAKGLEFDAVMAICTKGDYNCENERNLFYTVCSRALHVLNIYCEAGKPLLLKKIPGCLTGR